MRPSDARLLAAFEAGASYTQLAQAHGLSRNGVRGRINRARRERKAVPAAPPAPTVSVGLVLALLQHMQPPAADLPSDDSEAWAAALDKLKAMNRLARVLVLSDIHFPEHDPTALALAAELALWLDPDVIALNGDVMEFATLSDYALHYRAKRDDALKAVREPYSAFIRRLAGNCPHATLLHYEGNHDDRMGRYLAKHPELQDTLIDDYRALIRQGGRVLTLGDMQEVEIGDLLIQHGTRAGKNAASAALEDLGGAHSQIQGHTHMPAKVVKRVKHGASYRVVQSVVCGCLCRLTPGYVRHRTRHTKWLQGVVIAHVDPAGGLVNMQDVLFHPTRNGLAAVVGKKVFEVSRDDRSQSEAAAAASR